jgi:hypothetical protein
MADDAQRYDGVPEQAGAASKGEPSPVRSADNPASANRGQRAPRDGSGDVTGSGAGAGGGGGAEDFDADPVGGGGGNEMPRTAHPEGSGADAPKHGSR